MRTMLTTTLATTAIVGSVVVGGSLVTAESGLFGHRGGEKKLETTAEVLDISTDELKIALEDSTIEEVIQSYGYADMEAFFEASIPVIEANLSEAGLRDEEIAEKIEHIIEHRDIKGDVRDALSTALGLSREEVKASIESGMTFEEILSEAGFADKAALHAAVAESLTAAWEAEGISEEDINDRLERLEKRSDKREDRRDSLEERAEQMGLSIDELREKFQEKRANGDFEGRKFHHGHRPFSDLEDSSDEDVDTEGQST